MSRKTGLNKNRIFFYLFIILTLLLIIIGFFIFIKVEKQKTEMENRKIQTELDEYKKNKEAKLLSIDEKIRLRTIAAQTIIEAMTDITKKIETVKEEIKQIQDSYDKEVYTDNNENVSNQKIKSSDLSDDALMAIAKSVDNQKNIKINAKYDMLNQLNNQWDELFAKYDVLNKEIEDLKAERLQYE